MYFFKLIEKLQNVQPTLDIIILREAKWFDCVIPPETTNIYDRSTQAAIRT